MAIAVRSSSTLAFGTRTNSVIPAPSTIVNGDLLLAILNVGDPSLLPPIALTGPAGFTEATGSPFGTDRTDPYTISLRVFWKIAASESGSYTFTHGSASTECLMYALSGAHATTPLSPNLTTNKDANPGVNDGQTTVALGLTTAVNDCFIIMAEALWDDTTGMVVPTGTTPTFTQRLKGTLTYVSDGTLTTAGATGNKTHTNGNNFTTVPWVSMLISVQPAAAGALAVTGAQTTSAATQAGTIAVIGAVTGAQTTLAATQSGTITVEAFPALNVTGAQTTQACITTGTIGDVAPPEPETPVAPGGPSRAAQRRLKKAIENRSRFEEERARRLANLTNDRPLFVTPPETLKIINETLVEDIDHSVLFENEDQDEELLLLLMMI
jgi:hypothetical protein